MKTSKEILEHLIDALLEAEPIMKDRVRQPLHDAAENLAEIQRLAEELSEEAESDALAAIRDEQRAEIRDGLHG